MRALIHQADLNSEHWHPVQTISSGCPQRTICTSAEGHDEYMLRYTSVFFINAKQIIDVVSLFNATLPRYYDSVACLRQKRRWGEETLPLNVCTVLPPVSSLSPLQSVKVSKMLTLVLYPASSHHHQPWRGFGLKINYEVYFLSSGTLQGNNGSSNVQNKNWCTHKTSQRHIFKVRVKLCRIASSWL